MAEENKVSKESEKPKKRYELVEIATQTGMAVQDNKGKKVFNSDDLLVEILNKLENIEKAIA